MNQMHTDYVDEQSILNASVCLNTMVFQINKKYRKLKPFEKAMTAEGILKETREAIKYLQIVEAKLTGVIQIKFDDDNN